MRKSFERKIDSLGPIHGFVTEFVGENHLSEGAAYYIDFVLEELFTNAVKYNPDSKKNITLEITLHKKKLVITIFDEDPQSRPFDITSAAPFDRTLPLKDRRPGGLGIPLVRKMSDEIEYKRKNDHNMTTLIKYLE